MTRRLPKIVNLRVGKKRRYYNHLKLGLKKKLSVEGYTWHDFSISLNAKKKGFSDVRASFLLGIFKTKIKRKDIPQC